MPKVLLFRDVLLPISETFIAAQAGALSEYTPAFCCVRRANPTLPIAGNPPFLLEQKSDKVCRNLTRAYVFTKVAPWFHRAVEKLNPDLIHAHFAPDGATACVLAERLRVPLIVTLHGYDVTVKVDFKRKYSKLWKKADRFICVSEFIKKKALEAGFPADKLIVHYIGVDRSKFSAARARIPGMVLFVGRLTEKKGCTHLLDAMRKVQQIEPDAHLVIIGDGALRLPLEQQAANLKLNCRFLGSQPQSVIEEHMAGASVFCVPSITASNGDSEGLPIVIFEALAMGVPIVGSISAGIPEAIQDGVTGLLANERDHGALAEHILRFLRDFTFASQCAERGKELVASKFDLKIQTRSLEAIYADVSKGHLEPTAELKESLVFSSISVANHQ